MQISRCSRPMKAAVFAALMTYAGAGSAVAADQALIDAAKAEGELTWYTSFHRTALAEPMAEAFEEKYGIEVLISRQSAGDTALKLTNEGRAGQIQADVVDASVGVFGVIQDLLSPFAAEAVDDWPEEVRDPNELWAAAAMYYYSVAANTELVPEGEEPKTWEDLLDPRWKGEINWTADPTVNGPPGLIGNVLMNMGEEKGMEYLRKLAEQEIANIPGNHRTSLDQVIGGEYSLGLMNLNHHVASSREKDAPIRFAKINPVNHTIQYIGLLRDGPHNNAGKLFLDYLLSEEGQTQFQKAGYIPASPDVDALDQTLKPEGGGFEVFKITPEISSEHLEKWTAIYEELFR